MARGRHFAQAGGIRVGGSVLNSLLDKARAGGFSHGVVSFVNPDGYPMSVATACEAGSSSVELRQTGGIRIPTDRDVTVTWSHIRPQPGVGYDERRYISITGRVRGSELVPQQGFSWDEAEVPFFQYSELGVTRARAYMQSQRKRPRLKFGWLALRATRLPFVTAALVPVFLGAAVAASHGVFSWGLAALTALGAVLIHLGANVANDVFDTDSGADAANSTPTQFSGGSRVIHYGLVSRRTMILLSAAFYTAGASIGLVLAFYRSLWPILTLGVLGIAISLAYTAPGVRLVARGLGEVAVGIGFGPIMAMGAYFVQAQRFSWEALYASLPIALLIAAVLYVNEIPDRSADAAAKKKTLPVRLARDKVITGYGLLSGLAYLFVVAGVAAGIMPVGVLAALITAPIAFQVRRAITSHYDSPYGLMAAMGKGINLHLFTGLLIVGGYAADAILR